jgi:ribonucleoside-diphosphate reductase alpha chain
MAKSPRPSSDALVLRQGLRITRVFSTEGQHPFDTVIWERRTAAIYNSKGEAVFEQKDVEFPTTWSQLATNVVASKYFYGDLAAGNGDPREGKREYSLKQLIHRVTRTITDWGKEQGYFATSEDAERFYDELTWLCLHQYGAFNSPVWFNVGLYHQYGVRDTGGKTIFGWDFEKQRVVPVDPYERPQASACFIISVEDSIDDIWQLMAESARLFKFGSGVGADWSKLRSTKEKLSGGGQPSGPVSFMRVQDATGATIKSGGKTRRAAIMQTLKVWHPDILEFVTAKAKEEKKAWALIEQGYDGSFNGEAYNSVAFQNVNQSVRVTDEFMEAVLARKTYPLRAVTNGQVVEEIDAYELLYKVAEGTWICGDPGLQYEDTIQKWHTCKRSGPINSSNPCSEYMFLDNSACNLASLNLRKFQREDGSFDVERFRAAVRIFITAMEILVDNAGYPSEKIAQNSHDYRPLGLGFANLGAMLMAMGLPYDSDEGRAVAGAVTAIMHAEAYARSAEIAAIERIGPFPGFEKNRESMLEVMRMHQAAVEDIHPSCPAYLKEAARESMARMVALGERYGYRNAQATVLAPTGCLVGDSLIATDRGLVRLETLGNPEGAQWQDVSFRVFTDEGQKLATKFYVNGIEATRKIRTRAGYTIQGTLQHRIKVVDPDTGQWVWKRFSDIRPGDIVPLAMNTIIGQPRTVTLPPLGELHWNADRRAHVPRTVTPELAELVGYFMGDGSLHAKGLRFCVDERDQDVVAHLQQLIYRLFGLQAYIEQRQGYVEVGVHSVPLVLWWEACGFAKRLPSDAHQGKDYQPCIPDAILYTNDPAVYRAFLRGLFEADGTVIQGVPAFSTASESLAQEVRTLLLALGYPTQTKVEEDRRSARGRKSLQVLRLKNRGYNTRFLQEIRFIGVRKRQAVAEATTRSSAKRDRIYLEPVLVEELVPAGSPHRDAVILSLRRYGAIPRQRVEQLYEETADERLVQYMSYFYDVVEANEDGGEQLTYDLSVPENVTYTANGFISHNTISFMMDCDTTGIEPDIALVKYKLLAGKGDGMLKIVNNTVPIALRRLGYNEEQIKDILAYIEENDTIEGAPHIKEVHLPVFDCAFKPYKGQRFIHYMGHIKMMAACQPFISGAISKTVNMPEHVTVEEIMDAYIQGWKLGLKALAIYRENSKRSQPLSTRKEDKKADSSGDGVATGEPQVIEKIIEKVVYKPVRKRLPDERPSLTHKFSVAGHEGYLHIGLYPDTGMPGEIFITMAKQGSTISGLMDAFATAISIALQYGVPLEDLCNKFSHMRFEPAGFTNNPQIPIAKSIMDYIFRYLSLKFLGRPQEEKSENPAEGVAAEVKRSGPARDERQLELSFETQPTGPITPLVGSTIEAFLRLQEKAAGSPATTRNHATAFQNQEDAPACSNCGSITVRSGACYVCPNCGNSSGCG